jgi:uncharacterized YccA/Bax inhibitor family protein
VNLSSVIASFSVNIAVPDDAGLAAPVLVVGVVGGFSAALVSVAKRIVSAKARVAGTSTIAAASTAVHNRRIYSSFLFRAYPS